MTRLTDLEELLGSWRLQSLEHCAVPKFERRNWRGIEQQSAKSGHIEGMAEEIETWGLISSHEGFGLEPADHVRTRRRRTNCLRPRSKIIGGYNKFHNES